MVEVVVAVPAQIAIAVPRRVRFPRLPPLVVQLARYALVGGVVNAVYAAAFLLLRTWWDAVPTNLAALVLSTVVSTELNRRFTFGGVSTSPWRNAVQGSGTVLFYATYSSVVLVLLGLLVDSPSPQQESAVVIVASVLGGGMRFLVLRGWVFRDDPRATPPASGRGVT